jgi:hypothetical protein
MKRTAISVASLRVGYYINVWGEVWHRIKAIERNRIDPSKVIVTFENGKTAEFCESRNIIGCKRLSEETDEME